MIQFVTLFRLSDGTPLSATADDEVPSSISDAKKFIKLLGPRLVENKNERVYLQEDTYTIHCVHNAVVAFVAVCDPTYSHLLAYSFLDELVKEFNMLYNASVVAAVRRPYSFTEFDSFLQSVRQKYNSPRCVAARVNLPGLRAELSINPPTSITLSCPVTPAFTTTATSHHTTANGQAISNGHATDISQVGVSVLMKPLTVLGRLLIALACLLLLLDAYRAISSMAQMVPEEQDEEHGVLMRYRHVLAFLLEGCFMALQVFLLLNYRRFRKLWSASAVLVVALDCLLLMPELRDWWLSVVHMLVSVGLYHQTLQRNFREKLSKFNV